MIAKLANANNIWGGQVDTTIGKTAGDPDTIPTNPVMTSSCPTLTGGGDNGVDSNCLCFLPNSDF